MFQIENVIYVRFDRASYRVTEDRRSFPITLVTDRPPPRAFSVRLRSRNGNARCESLVAEGCSFCLAAAMNIIIV